MLIRWVNSAICTSGEPVSLSWILNSPTIWVFSSAVIDIANAPRHLNRAVRLGGSDDSRAGGTRRGRHEAAWAAEPKQHHRRSGSPQPSTPVPWNESGQPGAG